ncbi:MAG: hypothetical protein K9K38_16940 [Rhodoferax sp.]|nr:hypothetical protein [Rhodoferax sp.]
MSPSHQLIKYRPYIRMVAAVCCIFVITGTSASEISLWFKVPKFSSEIVLPGSSPSGSSHSATNATEARKKARESVTDRLEPMQAIIIEEPDQDGLVSRPRLGAPKDNRSKAAAYSNDKLPDRTPFIVVPHDAPLGSVESTRDGVNKNLNKARRYTQDEYGVDVKAGTFVKIGTAMGVVGPDGVVVVLCDQISNTAGRIGDDLRSGNTFTIVINGKVNRARCK